MRLSESLIQQWPALLTCKVAVDGGGEGQFNLGLEFHGLMERGTTWCGATPNVPQMME